MGPWVGKVFVLVGLVALTGCPDTDTALDAGDDPPTEDGAGEAATDGGEVTEEVVDGTDAEEATDGGDDAFSCETAAAQVAEPPTDAEFQATLREVAATTQVARLDGLRWDQLATAEAALDGTDGLSIEGAVRELLISIQGRDPLGPDGDPEGFSILVESASSRVDERCEAGFSIEEAYEDVITVMAAELAAARVRPVIDGFCSSLEAELKAAGATATDAAAAQEAVADRFDELISTLTDIGIPREFIVTGFVDELADDPDAQRDVSIALAQMTVASEDGDREAFDDGAAAFLEAAEITVIEAREAQAAAVAAELMGCAAVFEQNAADGQLALDAARAELGG